MLLKLALLCFLSINGVCCEECDLRCFLPMVSVFQSLKDKLITGNLVLSKLTSVCPAYQVYRQCIKTSIHSCDPNIQRTHQFLTDIFQFVCDESQEDIDTYDSCWTRKDTITDIQTCASEAFVYLSRQGQRCRFFEDFESCVFYRVVQLCGQEAGTLIANFLNRSNTQSKVDAQCITRPSERTRAPIQCYDCHNAPGSGSVNCPTNGTITDWWAAHVTCEGRCFARSPAWNREIVYRGCTAGFWLPAPLPRSGCWTLNGDSRDIWCLCDSDLCNTMDMTDIVLQTKN